jgi:hypothetical protein
MDGIPLGLMFAHHVVLPANVDETDANEERPSPAKRDRCSIAESTSLDPRP